MEKRGAVKITELDKSFKDNHVVNQISLDIKPGQFISFLGPSGCGKTTILRMIAGFETIDGGDIEIDGKSVIHLPPEKRELNTVFQQYALFPHLNVYDNIAYGLRAKGKKKAEIQKAVTEALKLVQLEGFEKRMPAKLSGGQQQRVAIARSLVNKPRVLLLDEPLGALDMKLRKQMQIDLKQMQRDSKITYVYVTHDQEEALTISDRIVVLNGGKIEQQGKPWEIYHHPKTKFVASFLGESNFFTDDVTIAVRPEFICIHKENSDKRIPALVQKIVYMGVSNRIELVLENNQKVYALSQEDYQIGDRVYIDWLPENAERIED